MSFLSKTAERCVASHLANHLEENDLFSERQSAYCKHHSTETALVRISSDILQAVDTHGEVILVLLDLTTAFDTIEHSVLLQRLKNRYGISATALVWFKSYLSERTRSVVSNDNEPEPFSLDDGVPQGSVFGPQGFTMYTAP